MGNGNPLLLRLETEGLLARYRPLSTTHGAPLLVMLLIRYPTEGAARDAHRNFRSAHTTGWKDQDAVRTAGGGWSSSCYCLDLVAVVLAAPDRREARRLIQAVKDLGGER